MQPGKKRARLQHIEIPMDRKPVRDGLFHHQRVGWYDLGKLIGNPARVDGFLLRASQRLILPSGFSFFVTVAPSLRAPRRAVVTLGDSFLTDSTRYFMEFSISPVRI